ncbi:MAG: glycerophosphodiester phosphodiesterase, partial [Prevotellaceae bacterium]|nr:glycerophosphodiester phosphodiesterase [Prevotellaceae bacterium]
MKRFVFWVSLALTCTTLPAQETTVPRNPVIAHRGYWKAEGAAENSIASLLAAQNLKMYGSEFDVWLTMDGVAVIHHDSHIAGKNIEKTTYAEIRDCKLDNGEYLPTLDA